MRRQLRGSASWRPPRSPWPRIRILVIVDGSGELLGCELSGPSAGISDDYTVPQQTGDGFASSPASQGSKYESKTTDSDYRDLP